MGTASEDRLQLAADVFETIGDSATFTPAVGDAVSLYVVVSDEILVQPGNYDSNIHATATRISFALADIGREPNRGEIFLVDSTTYTCKAVEFNNGYVCRVIVQ